MDSNTFTEFQRITGQDVKSFLQSFQDFMSSGFQRIYDYYNGNLENNPTESISDLKSLNERLTDIEDAVSIKSNQLNRYDFWELQEELLLSREQIDTTENLPKWLRSSNTNGIYSGSPTIEYYQKQGQTLEGIQRDELGSDDPDNDYYRLALNNRVIEEDYTPNGGLKLNLEIGREIENFNIQSVVDTIDNSVKFYGLDIDKKITFVGNDLKVLSYKETLEQSAFILLNLRKGDNPEFFGQGIDKRLAAGSNLAAFNYPVILRQIYEVFRSDDSFSSIQLLQINNVEDSIRMEFEINPKKGEGITSETTV